MIQKEYRWLQFTVSLFPIGIGFYYGRLREELFESRKNAELLRGLISTEQPEAESSDSENLDIILTPREKEVLGLVATGLSNKEIAVKLFLSDKTIKTHLRNIYKKLDVNDRTAAAVLALRDGLVE